MKHIEGYFKGAGNINIYYQCWLPKNEPKAILLVVHGLAEHSGRYINIANHFVPMGYAVYGIDHIGHGKSDGKRVYIEQFQDYIQTIKIYFDMIRDWQTEKPIFMIGHSLGGLITTAYLLKYEKELSGAILSGPAIKMPDISQITIYTGKILSLILPRIGLLQLNPDGVSRDPAVIDTYINDPLVYTGKITARLGAEMLKNMQEVTKHASNIGLPIMIMQGSDDKLVNPDGAQLLYDLVASKDKTLKVYDGFYHELFNEPGHEQVINDIKIWLEAQLETIKK